VRLDSRYRVLWFADTDEVDEDAVLDLWAREAGLVGAPARERLAELACVALEADDGLVGVSTAYLADNAQLRTPMWHYRTFVSAGHRQENLARHLLHGTTIGLEERFVSGADTRAPGMVMYIENEALRQRWSHGIWIVPDDDWDGAGWPFIGANERGDHARVHWFAGAQAPLPE
jgi:hypothetical protein